MAKLTELKENWTNEASEKIGIQALQESREQEAMDSFIMVPLAGQEAPTIFDP